MESVLYYLIDFAVAIVLICAMRWLSGLVASASSTDELSKRDNPAFGISLAGAIVSVAIMLMGAVSGEIGSSLTDEWILMLSYGMLGIALLATSRFLFDRIALPRVSVAEEISKGNAVAGVIDAGNMIATAIIIRAVMTWVDTVSLYGLASVLVGYLFSQVILVLATWYRKKIFRSRHDHRHLYEEIIAGNMALGLRFVGHRIGLALAVSAASALVVYDLEHRFLGLVQWGGVALLMCGLLTGVSWFAKKVFLSGLSATEEVDQQANVAIGAVEASVYIGLGLLISALFS